MRTRHRRFQILWAVALTGAWVASGSVGPRAAAQAASPEAPATLSFAGVAFNAVANASPGFELVIGGEAGGEFAIRGAFDSRNLFGRFEGRGVDLACGEPSRCLQFTGTFEVGGDGSGFPAETTAPFTLTMVLEGTKLTGVYHIGRLPGLPLNQYGTLDGFAVP